MDEHFLKHISCIAVWTVYWYLQVFKELCQVLQRSVLVAAEFAPDVVMLLLQFGIDLIGLLEELSGAAKNVKLNMGMSLFTESAARAALTRL